MSEEISSYEAFAWQRPFPFISQWKIEPESIDHYYHTNNTAYLKRLESLAWEHSNALGMNFENYRDLDRAMVITKHELNYHFATHLNDELAVATWITHCDKKFRLTRFFEFINVFTQKTVFTATTDFVCVCLSSGAPKRMPKEFIEVYSNANQATQMANIGA